MKYSAYVRVLPVFAVAMVVLMVAACSVVGVPAPKSFNDRVAAAVSSITTVRQTTIVLLERDKITAKDAQNIQNTANQARDGLEVARELYRIQPRSGEERLEATIRILESLQRYVDKRAKE